MREEFESKQQEEFEKFMLQYKPEFRDFNKVGDYTYSNSLTSIAYDCYLEGLRKNQAVLEFPVTVFDEWFKNRHEKTGLYEEALCGKDDATYIRHEMRKAFQAGWKEKQAVQEGFVLVSKDKLHEWKCMARRSEELGCPDCYESRGYAHNLAEEIEAQEQNQ